MTGTDNAFWEPLLLVTTRVCVPAILTALDCAVNPLCRQGIDYEVHAATVGKSRQLADAAT